MAPSVSSKDQQQISANHSSQPRSRSFLLLRVHQCGELILFSYTSITYYMPTLITSACLPAILLSHGPTQLEWRVTFKCGRIELCVQFDVAGADFNCPRTCSLAPSRIVVDWQNMRAHLAKSLPLLFYASLTESSPSAHECATIFVQAQRNETYYNCHLLRHILNHHHHLRYLLYLCTCACHDHHRRCSNADWPVKSDM